ncbi:unnamed protein product [Peronospora belbahrii]|uniref:Uncharacterized protein n=1 Tax=Peronospora belbahrii TaxID=622444 RepID=A0AAU9L182_9STRA|nr:unnamed protein product [Peronospora belbahrii]
MGTEATAPGGAPNAEIALRASSIAVLLLWRVAAIRTAMMRPRRMLDYKFGRKDDKQFKDHVSQSRNFSEDRTYFYALIPLKMRLALQ